MQRRRRRDVSERDAPAGGHSVTAQQTQQHTQDTQAATAHSQQCDGGSTGGRAERDTAEAQQRRWMRSNGGEGAESAVAAGGVQERGSSLTTHARETGAGPSQNRAQVQVERRITEESRKRRWSMRNDAWRANRRRKGTHGAHEGGTKRRRVSVAAQVEVSMITVQRIVGGRYDVGDSQYGVRPLKRPREAGRSDGRYEREKRRQRRATGDG